MPVICSRPTHRISQKEFGSIAYEVMTHVFDIHDEFGRFFDERVYKQELAARVPGISLEVALTLVFEDFSKTLFLDALVRESALFEFKTADAIHSRHRGQTVNYLLLADLEHAKIVNLRPERVEHEFVNCTYRLADLRDPKITENDWEAGMPQATRFRDLVVAVVRDWGMGLDLTAYEEAVSHCLGGDSTFVSPVSVFGRFGHVGEQRLRLLNPETAFKLTALAPGNSFTVHARRLLQHTPLTSVYWANITHQGIQFSMIRDRKMAGKR